MDTENPFVGFVRRLRAREEAAAKDFIENYAPLIFQVIGKKLTRFSLHRFLDPADICQDVFAKFFAKIADHFEFAGPEDIRKLLVKMTHDQIIDEFQHSVAKGRNRVIHELRCGDLAGIRSSTEEASQVLEREEELRRIHEQMTEDEWYLASARAAGQTWNELATELGQSPDALRMKLARSRARIRHNLRLE